MLGAAGAFEHGAKDQPIKSALDPLGDVETLRASVLERLCDCDPTSKFNHDTAQCMAEGARRVDALILAAEARGRQVEKDDQSRSAPASASRL